MAILAQLIDDVVVHKFELNADTTLVGRKTDCGIVINEAAISSNHAQILRQRNPFFEQYVECYVEDLGSTNGTFLNGQRVVGKQRLRHGDLLRLAWNEFKFIDDSEEEMERTVHMIQSRGLS